MRSSWVIASDLLSQSLVTGFAGWSAAIRQLQQAQAEAVAWFTLAASRQIADVGLRAAQQLRELRLCQAAFGLHLSDDDFPVHAADYHIRVYACQHE